MSKPTGKSPITVRLELSIPTNLGVPSEEEDHTVQRSCLFADTGIQVQKSQRQVQPRQPRWFVSVTHPAPGGGGSTTVKTIGAGYHVMCARGTKSGSERHIAAKVYLNDGYTTVDDAPPPNDNLVRILNVQGVETWQISDLRVPAPTGSYQLAVWTDDGTGYIEPDIITFTAQAGTQTFCEANPLPQPAMFRQASRQQDWSNMPRRWHFTVTGCSNRKCSNCACLNGQWIIARDTESAHRYRWSITLKESFSDPKRPGYWRLLFNPNDGFWYLECVENLEQVPGTWISYRLHESVWNPSGANKLLLHTDSGYCNVPNAITIIPA